MAASALAAIDVAPGDYFVAKVFQNSLGSLDLLGDEEFVYFSIKVLKVA